MSLWGKLANRFEGREAEPHKILSLDGGGIRGVLTLEVLARIEEMLREESEEGREHGEEFRLCHYFDYIGGTSTGAIIAAGLARGKSVADLLDFYVDAGPAMFDKRTLLKRWHALYKDRPLQEKLQEVFGEDTTLEPDDLETLLLVVTRNETTDSPWPISSNPQSKYNDPERLDCNLRIPLWQLVRASTAAP